MAEGDAIDLRLLLATDLPGAGAEVHRAVARLARTCRLQVTTVHVSPRDRAPAQYALEAFAAEGPYTTRCVLVRSHDAVGAVAELCNSDRFDLVMAPASQRRALPLPWTSFRMQLLRRTSLPLWTGGTKVSAAAFLGRVRTIACFIDFDDHPDGMLEAAASFAARLGARLRAISVLPPLDDGSIGEVGTSRRPLTPLCAQHRVSELVSGYPVDDVHAGLGERGPELRRMLQRIDADLLLVGRRQAAIGSLGFRLPRDLDRLPCPVLCIDAAASRPGWCLPRPREVAAPSRDMVGIAAAAAMARRATAPIR